MCNDVGQGVNETMSLVGDRVLRKKSVSDDETHTYAAVVTYLNLRDSPVLAVHRVLWCFAFAAVDFKRIHHLLLRRTPRGLRVARRFPTCLQR